MHNSSTPRLMSKSAIWGKSLFKKGSPWRWRNTRLTCISKFLSNSLKSFSARVCCVRHRSWSRPLGQQLQAREQRFVNSMVSVSGHEVNFPGWRYLIRNFFQAEYRPCLNLWNRFMLSTSIYMIDRFLGKVFCRRGNILGTFRRVVSGVIRLFLCP